jgi:hypothetical protein
VLVRWTTSAGPIVDSLLWKRPREGPEPSFQGRSLAHSDEGPHPGVAGMTALEGMRGMVIQHIWFFLLVALTTVAMAACGVPHGRAIAGAGDLRT